MSWLRIDLGGRNEPLPHDCGSARSRRITLLRRLLEEPTLCGGTALDLVQELRLLELREAVETLQDSHPSA
jgi:hypothetical protein